MLGILTTLFETYIGLKGSQDQWKNILDVFWPTVGTGISIVGGTLSAASIGMTVINTVVKSKYWSKEDGYFGANYILYGGSGPIGNLLGFIELGWVLVFLCLGFLVASVPYWLSTRLEEYIALNGDSPTFAEENNFKFLSNGVVIALGSWQCAWII